MRQRVRQWAALGLALGLVALLVRMVGHEGARPQLPTAKSGPGPSGLPAGTAAPPRRPRVAVDPGHGGSDVGGKHTNAQGAVDLTESEVNLQVALLLRSRLEARGCDVYLTRTDGSIPGEPLQDWNGDGEVNVRDELQLRIDRINAQGADLLISLHENALDDADPLASCASSGTATYYCADRPFTAQSVRLANLVHSRVLATIRSFGYEPADQGVIDDRLLETPAGKGHHLYILGPHDNVIARPSNMPGVLSEPLFLTCEPEAALLARDDFRTALADAYAEAIMAYLAGEG